MWSSAPCRSRRRALGLWHSLDAAKGLDDALARAEAKAHDDARGLAALLAERGRVSRLQLHYREAAGFYARAAEIASFDPAAALGYGLTAADALFDRGNEFGDNPALVQAIAGYRSALERTPRDSTPADWASTQSLLGKRALGPGRTRRWHRPSGTSRRRLPRRPGRMGPGQACLWIGRGPRWGLALRGWRRLAKRESGTAQLEEAVAAYRLALQESTRDRVPLDWATTQNNLGNALETLGERESGTARLEEAVAAYRLALEEGTRDRVPLDWANTQNNLANALETLGERESGTAQLEETVAAYRLALQERTRDRVPPVCRPEQPGHRAGGARRTRERHGAVEEAVAAYRLALQESTRDRAARLGHDPGQPGHRAGGARRTRERHGAAGGNRRRLPPRAPREDPRPRAAQLGHHPEQPWHRAGDARRTRERHGAAGRRRRCLSPRAARVDPRPRAARLGQDPKNNLGLALATLGERESGTARLEEAVAAYRLALQGEDSATTCRSTGPRPRTTLATRWRRSAANARAGHGAAGGSCRRLPPSAARVDTRPCAARLG